jgi:hypothetical protein
MQEYIDVQPQSVVITTADRMHSVVAHDLKTILEGLVNNQGEEAVISHAEVETVLSRATGTTVQASFAAALVLMISDAAISAQLNQNFKNLDAFLDTLTAGDFEYQRLTPFKMSRITGASDASDKNATEVVTLRADITKQLKKAARKLIYSAILATNPEIALVVVVRDGGTTTVYAGT